jgi:FtsP/CotA-like multicopper oxidase with cupredoxin domain
MRAALLEEGRPPRSRSRLLVGTTAALLLLFGGVTSVAQVDEPPQACGAPTRSITMFAEPLGPDRFGYGLTPGTASIPGPTLEMREGECLAVTLVNDTERRLSMHAHGVDYTVASDGTPLNAGCVAPGRARTYFFAAHAPATRPDGSLEPGSAGYWHYHDHCMRGEHGTEGIRSGLFGGFIVRRPGDPVPDVPTFVVVMGPGKTIGLLKAPDTPVFEAELGQRIEFEVITHGDLFHTFHLHGHRWVDNRSGLPASAEDQTAVIDNRTVGPADSFGFQAIAGEGVGPGAWMYHCHVQGHSDAGMTGIFLVTAPGGLIPVPVGEALERWREGEDHEHH